ncbi:hypothetical protein LGL55_10485 [Clostridium tagluense]|nr:hypothetical protein [Clostridium tagluense]MCB2300635.1 hypothetical protein [Clostridium tagluense]MCB2311634.1 hypothetical protein [Clostridium tagluense]MCB2316358.1 hypothetical protein [Clostridium tagluense]MCB2321258.1 hypothetical protein [Clostridium tagluense]MCB2326227.1 hypothetical protein [Clostridium tagluense]
MGNDLKVIIKLLEEINGRLDRLENKNKVIGTRTNRLMRVTRPTINGGRY